MTDWQTAGTVSELASLFASIPPPVPTAVRPQTPMVTGTPAPVAAPPVTTPQTVQPHPTSITRRTIHSLGGGTIWDWSFNNGIKTTNNNNTSYDGFQAGALLGAGLTTSLLIHFFLEKKPCFISACLVMMDLHCFLKILA